MSNSAMVMGVIGGDNQTALQVKDKNSGTALQGRKRKRKRQVSWAAAELLEEIKVFHMAKPVNPSLPPPALDDGGEGDGNEDPARQPGLALLGLLGVEAASSSPSSPPPYGTKISRTMHPSVAAGDNNVSSAAGTTGTTTASMSSLGMSLVREGGQLATVGGGGLSGDDIIVGGGDVGGAPGTGAGADAGAGSAGGRGLGSGSSLFKGFQKTETVVRRKKQLAPPPPPPGTPPPLPPPGEGTHIHRYPKDIWPGHAPSKHSSDGNNAHENGSASATGGGSSCDEGSGEGQLLEFFCDRCDETIPTGTERMECAVCPDEFCLCLGCYDEAEVLDKRHEHELLPSVAPFHITRAAPSAEAAAAAAAALHVTEEAASQDDYDDDLG